MEMLDVMVVGTVTLGNTLIKKVLQQVQPSHTFQETVLTVLAQLIFTIQLFIQDIIQTATSLTKKQ